MFAEINIIVMKCVHVVITSNPMWQNDENHPCKQEWGAFLLQHGKWLHGTLVLVHLEGMSPKSRLKPAWPLLKCQESQNVIQRDPGHIFYPLVLKAYKEELC